MYAIRPWSFFDNGSDQGMFKLEETPYKKHYFLKFAEKGRIVKTLKVSIE